MTVITSIKQSVGNITVEDIHIGDVHSPGQYRNVYVATTTLSGMLQPDEVTIDHVFKVNELAKLKQFLRFCSQCSQKYPVGKWPHETYADIPTYWEWYPATKWWPRQVHNGKPYYASYIKTTVLFYDADGVPYNTRIVVKFIE